MFESYDQYVDEVKAFLTLFHKCNQIIGILPRNDEGGFDIPIITDVFWAYGAHGHMRVHTSLMLVYAGKTQGTFVGFKMDLKNAKHNALTHQVIVFNGVDETVWTHFEGTMEMSYSQFLPILQSNIQSFEKKYSTLSANCIQFKNNLLEEFDKHINTNFPRASVSVSQSDFNEIHLEIPTVFQGIDK